MGAFCTLAHNLSTVKHEAAVFRYVEKYRNRGIGWIRDGFREAFHQPDPLYLRDLERFARLAYCRYVIHEYHFRRDRGVVKHHV